MGIKDFLHYTEVENMHTIIGLLKRDCGISFMYKIAVADELKNGTLKEIRLSDFKMQHDFDFIWEKGSIYTEKYIGICEELLKSTDIGRVRHSITLLSVLHRRKVLRRR